jgi:paired amphipathic helix protein Sin3a
LLLLLLLLLLLQSMVQDEQTMRLVDLHKYEAARRLPISDEVYRANANILLHDEPCYR